MAITGVLIAIFRHHLGPKIYELHTNFGETIEVLGPCYASGLSIPGVLT